MKQAVYDGLVRAMKAAKWDEAHDEEHIYRVLCAALDIAAFEAGVDHEILVAACLLHDIGRAAEATDPAVCHAAEGARMAPALLEEAGFPQGKIAAVCACIAGHRHRKGPKPEGIEARILFDADKLDVCGAIGIARTLQYGGAYGEPLYTRDGQGRVLDGSGKEPESFMREYRHKLAGLYDGFYTARGAALAAGRKKAAEGFYRALLAELEGGFEEDQKNLGKMLEN